MTQQPLPDYVKYRFAFWEDWDGYESALTEMMTAAPPPGPAVSLVPRQPPAEEYIPVKKGDTLWGIAEKYLGSGVRYKEIKTLNGLDSDTIYNGQKLKIPN